MQIDEIKHGDCIDVMSQMSNNSVHLTLTDIPYDECDKPSGGLRKIDKGSADYLNFDLNVFLNNVQRVTSGSIYIFCGIQQVSTIYKKFRTGGMITRHCVWQKSNPSPMNGQSTWLSALENCIFAKFSGATFNESCKPNVWKYKSGTAKVRFERGDGRVYSDVALEFLSDEGNNVPGWICKETKADYWIYMNRMNKTVQLIHVKSSQAAWQKYKDEWAEKWPFQIRAYNDENGRKWTTVSRGVPVDVLDKACQEFEKGLRTLS